MGTFTLLLRNLAWYWRTNLAVLLGVATAAGVLGGALLVGNSVRASLRDLALARLGNADFVISRNGFFREQLASAFGSACPVIAIDGVITHEASGRQALRVQVYGVDERFWKLQAESGEPPRGRQVLMSAAVERELGAQPGDAIVLGVEKPSEIPLESLNGRKEDLRKSIRLTVTKASFREFSLRRQTVVSSVLVPLARLQSDLNQTGRVNTILVSAPGASAGSIESTLKDRYTLEDLGLHLRHLETQRLLSLESDGALISDALADVASATAVSLGLHAEPVLTYLATKIRVGGRQIPYSVVTALDFPPAPADAGSITLNGWAARQLRAKPGDAASLDYYVWGGDGRLRSQSASFHPVQIVALEGPAADRDFTPSYPGITESRSLHDWDPPFPIDLSLVRPVDEQYWTQYRATPKAFVRLARGQQLWGTRFGQSTSIRIFPPSEEYSAALRRALDPRRMGFAVFAARAVSLAAARGATDFGQYFIYFSFFLILSALLLTGLFFKLGVEQRLREIGTLRALGFSLPDIRRLFLLEGAALAVAGGLAGIAAALVYGEFIMFGLRNWWIDAVGTDLLWLHSSLPLLALGAAAGMVTGLSTMAWTLRGLQASSARRLLAEEVENFGFRRRWPLIGTAAGASALILSAAALLRKVDLSAGFFGVGALSLIALLCFEFTWINSSSLAPISGLLILGIRGAGRRPGRSILCIALLASTTFIIVSLEIFHRRLDESNGTGGFQFVAESVLPLIHNPSAAAGRSALSLPPLDGVEFVPFRLRSGDDVSCLNLYKPLDPQFVAAPAAFLRTAQFPFADSPANAANPWLLLELELPDGAIPAIVDANSMTYALHLKVGEEFALNQSRFRIVAALHGSIFQDKVLISEKNFVRLFPDVEGYRFFLLKVAQPTAVGLAGVLERSLADYAFHVQTAEMRLGEFLKVENAYLAAFRSLGMLGLLLGTVGLAAVLLRNALERRREFALLQAVGYRTRDLALMGLAENAFLLVIGLSTGSACAVLAATPAALMRGGHLPFMALGILLAAALLTGIAASLVATAAALPRSVLTALRSE